MYGNDADFVNFPVYFMYKIENFKSAFFGWLNPKRVPNLPEHHKVCNLLGSYFTVIYRVICPDMEQALVLITLPYFRCPYTAKYEVKHSLLYLRSS